MKLIACYGSPLRPLRKGFVKKVCTIKLTLLFLFAFGISAMANGHSQSVTLSLKDAPLEKVFKEITRQTGYNFVYTETVLRKSRPVSISVSNAPLTQVLNECFKNQALSFSVLNNLIIIKEKIESTSREKAAITQDEKVSALSPAPLARIITGTVVDDKERPLADVSVFVKGTNTGTHTDKNGRFTLTIEDPNSTLILTYIGFANYELPLNGKAEISVKMTPESAAMQNVVVTALGI
ncbi:MAG TPA: carboxypeptidase-like regulatory domain-containing protein, partial [Flavisolibacter sp.]|nr:carboxypeptidase-like regulatory domain-containing protein [Flavisolibacter sp.]